MTYKNATRSIPIQVDDRESQAPVLQALRQCADFEVAVTRLKLGDYPVDGRFLFERKTMSDLAMAIIDGRLFGQALRHGDTIVPSLSRVLENHPWSAGASHGEWWRLLHAVMILGLIPTEAAGLLLVQYMRRMSEQENDNLQDWLAGHWPALFDNKPVSLLPALRALSEDWGFLLVHARQREGRHARHGAAHGFCSARRRAGKSGGGGTR